MESLVSVEEAPWEDYISHDAGGEGRWGSRGSPGGLWELFWGPGWCRPGLLVGLHRPCCTLLAPLVVSHGRCSMSSQARGPRNHRSHAALGPFPSGSRAGLRPGPAPAPRTGVGKEKAAAPGVMQRSEGTQEVGQRSGFGAGGSPGRVGGCTGRAGGVGCTGRGLSLGQGDHRGALVGWGPQQLFKRPQVNTGSATFGPLPPLRAFFAQFENGRRSVTARPLCAHLEDPSSLHREWRAPGPRVKARKAHARPGCGIRELGAVVKGHGSRRGNGSPRPLKGTAPPRAGGGTAPPAPPRPLTPAARAPPAGTKCPA